MSLEHNNDIRKTLPVWLENEKYVVQVIQEKWGLKDQFTEDEIFSVRNPHLHKICISKIIGVCYLVSFNKDLILQLSGLWRL